MLLRPLRMPVLLCVAGAAVLAVLPHTLRIDRPLEPAVVAVVDGQPLQRADMHIALAGYRRLAIEDMVRQTLVRREAVRRGIRIPPATKAVPGNLFPDEQLALQRQAQADQLKREIVLRSFSRAEKLALYEDFSPQLKRYTVVVVVFADVEDATLFQRELADGRSFESLVGKYTVDVGLGRHGYTLKDVTSAEISSRLGPYAADSLAHVARGAVSPRVPSPFGLMQMKVVDVQSSYAEVEAFIDQILVDSESRALDHRLAMRASISSPFIRDSTRSQEPLVLPSASQAPTARLVLKEVAAGPVAHSPGLPRLKPRPRPPAVAASATAAPRIVLSPATPAPRFLGPLRATLEVEAFRLLPARVEGGSVLRLDRNGNHFPDGDEPVLVRAGPVGWQRVSHCTESISRITLERDYGYWTDRQRSHFDLWSASRVVDRRRDGRIQPDEVQLCGLQRTRPMRFLVGAEIVADGGHLVHHEQSASFSARLPVDEADLQRLKDYRDTESNWQVPHHE